MIYFIDSKTGELKQGYVALQNWQKLPIEYQNKCVDDITVTAWDTMIIVCHPDLKPAIYKFGAWSYFDNLKLGTKVILENGLLSFHEPRPTPTEQRDAFQKNYPYLVKDCRQDNWFPRPTGPIKTGVENELPKVIQDQLDVSPLHYRKGEIQPWDFITSQGMSFLEGNVVKYLTRYKHKNGVADLKKARTYLDKLISEVSKCVKNSEK
jgi:hypothetical protein